MIKLTMIITLYIHISIISYILNSIGHKYLSFLLFLELTKEEQSKCGIGRATLPVYCAGVLSAFESVSFLLMFLVTRFIFKIL